MGNDKNVWAKWNNAYFLIFLVVLASCNLSNKNTIHPKNDLEAFYKMKKVDDQYFIPLKYPIFAFDNMVDMWSVGIESMGHSINCDSINFIKNEFIIGVCISRCAISHNTVESSYEIYKISTDDLFVFSNYSEFSIKCKSLGVSTKVYNTKDLFENWLTNDKLPW